MNWRTNVHGGTNTDTDSGTTLGFYYKFNEGTKGTDSLDTKVLDYSGRTTNGTWIGYSSNARSVTSALEAAGVKLSEEEKDPVIYSSHPELSSLKARLEVLVRYTTTKTIPICSTVSQVGLLTKTTGFKKSYSNNVATL